jgi:hypothetical protein
LTASAGVDPQTVLTDGAGIVDVVANQATPSDGVTELEIANPTIALRASDSANAPHLVLTLDSSIVPSVRVRYLIRDRNRRSAPGDDGLGGDTTAGDNVFSTVITVPTRHCSRVVGAGSFKEAYGRVTRAQ